MVGFSDFFTRGGQALNDRPHVVQAPAQSDALLHVATVDQQAHAIAGVERDLRERERGVYREVELAQLTYAGAKQAAGVHDDPDGLAALHLEELGHVLAAAGGGGPADVAELVAFLVFTQAFKFPAYAALANQAFFQLDLAGAGEINVMAFSVFKIGKDADGLGERGTSPAFGKLRAAAITQISRAQLDITALQRTNSVARGCRIVGRRWDGDFRRMRNERSGQIVEHAALDGDAALVEQLDGHFGRIAERGRMRPRALEHQAVSAGKAGEIDSPGDHGAKVPGGHDEEEAYVPERRNGPEQAEQRDEKEAPAKAEAQAFGAMGARAHRFRRKQTLLHYLGTRTELMISARTRSLSRPSSSASGFIITRWRRTGSAEDLTSSGIMKSRPSRPAAALETIMRLMAARGLAPRASEGHPRLRRMISIM